jgi:hypothetical protein
MREITKDLIAKLRKIPIERELVNKAIEHLEKQDREIIDLMNRLFDVGIALRRVNDVLESAERKFHARIP